MKPSEDPELIEWMRRSFQERNIVPLINHLIKRQDLHHTLVGLTRNSISNYKQFFSCLNIFVEIHEQMSQDELILLNERLFNSIDESIEIKKRFRLNNPHMYS